MMRLATLVLLISACATEDDLLDRDVPLEGPLELDEPDDPAEADVPDVGELDVADGDELALAARGRELTLRVLHWNIAGGKVHDCRTAGIASAVRRLVREHDIGLVGLNEVCPAQFDAIRAELRELWGKPHEAHFAAYVSDDGGRIVGNAIFSKRDFEAVTREQVGEDQYGKRNLLCARDVALPHLRFCSTHLTPANDRASVQAGRVRETLEAFWRDRRDTVVIAGDFNIMPNHRGLNGWYSEAADHPRHNADNRGHYRELDDNDAGHCLGFGERSTPNLDGGPCEAGNRIDLIFARENRLRGDNYGADVMNIPTTCGGACSDHRPVRGRLRAIVRVE